MTLENSKDYSRKIKRKKKISLLNIKTLTHHVKI